MRLGICNRVELLMYDMTLQQNACMLNKLHRMIPFVVSFVFSALTASVGLRPVKIE